MKKILSKVTAAALALALFGGAVPFKAGNGFINDTAIVANAEDLSESIATNTYSAGGYANNMVFEGTNYKVTATSVASANGIYINNSKSYTAVIAQKVQIPVTR